MTKKDLLKLLESEAKRYRTNVFESLVRNSHLNGFVGQDLMKLLANGVLTQKFIDAILVDFINTVAEGQGIDLGLRVKHVQPKK